MQYTALLLAVAGFAAAQTTTGGTATSVATGVTAGSTAASGCGTQVDQIIQTCLGTENAQLQACPANDWNCLCTQTTNVLTCYNNCPSDPNTFQVQQQQTSYCNAAKQYGSSSSSSFTNSATASLNPSLSSALATASASKTTGASGSSTGSASASAASASKSSAANANAVVPVGGFAALLGIAAIL